MVDSKILDWPACARWIVARQQAGERVVFTNGCFDVLHAGHIYLLEQALGLGDRLVVGLNSDASVRRLKGPSRPVNPLPDRLAVLGALAAVSVLVVFPPEMTAGDGGQGSRQDTPYDLLEELRPDVLVKGGDYSPEEVVGREFAGDLRIIPLLPGRSTRDILGRAGRSAVDSAPSLN